MTGEMVEGMLGCNYLFMRPHIAPSKNVYEHCCKVRRETFEPKEIVRYNLIIVVIIIPAYCGSTYTILVQMQGIKCSLPQRASKLRMRQETTDGHR